MSTPRPPKKEPSDEEVVVDTSVVTGLASMLSTVTDPASAEVGLALAVTVPAAVLVEASPVVVEVLPSAPT
jgi:hypothetical protein